MVEPSLARSSGRVAGAVLATSEAVRPRPGPASPAAGRPSRSSSGTSSSPLRSRPTTNFLGNQIAGHLRAQPGISVRSVSLDDPEHGLWVQTSSTTCRVLIWWGHVRQAEIAPEVGQGDRRGGSRRGRSP